MAMQGMEGIEATAARLQRAINELDAAADYFERLGMDTQVTLLDEAQDRADDVRELLECLLGRVTLGGSPEAPEERAKPKSKTLGKAHLVKRKVA